jgi:hypothetical protein
MADPTYNLNGGFKPTTKRFADLDGPDFFPTPWWATFALIDNEKFKGQIWECACGDGTMSRVLEETGCPVPSSDLYERGYGEAGYDFLKPHRSADNIVTNPPYNCAEGFVTSGVKHARSKFALLLRLAFLEGSNRAKPYSHAFHLREYGRLASGLLSTRPVQYTKVPAQRRMLGLFGTRMRRVKPN